MRKKSLQRRLPLRKENINFGLYKAAPRTFYCLRNEACMWVSSEASNCHPVEFSLPLFQNEYPRWTCWLFKHHMEKRGGSQTIPWISNWCLKFLPPGVWTPALVAIFWRGRGTRLCKPKKAGLHLCLYKETLISAVFQVGKDLLGRRTQILAINPHLCCVRNTTNMDFCAGYVNLTQPRVNERKKFQLTNYLHKIGL